MLSFIFGVQMLISNRKMNSKFREQEAHMSDTAAIIEKITKRVSLILVFLFYIFIFYPFKASHLFAIAFLRLN